MTVNDFGNKTLINYGFPDYWDVHTKIKKLSGDVKMSKVEKEEYEFIESMKAADVTEDIETEITKIEKVKTEFGDKRLATLKTDDKIFLNRISIGNLVDVFGDETDDWINKKIKVTTETSDRTRNKKSIVVEKVE